SSLSFDTMPGAELTITGYRVTEKEIAIPEAKPGTHLSVDVELFSGATLFLRVNEAPIRVDPDPAKPIPSLHLQRWDGISNVWAPVPGPDFGTRVGLVVGSGRLCGLRAGTHRIVRWGEGYPLPASEPFEVGGPPGATELKLDLAKEITVWGQVV